MIVRWRLLSASISLSLAFASRQTGLLPGSMIRVADVALVAAVLAVAVSATPTSTATRFVHALIVGVVLVAAAVGNITGSADVQRAAGWATSYLLAVSSFFLFRGLVRARRVDADTFFGALAGYLVFGTVFTVLARGDPSVFLPPQPIVDGQSDLYYFSLVTLTTLGYGDIAPASDLVRVLAPLEAVLGALVIAGLVGRIVGLLVAQATEAREPPGNRLGDPNRSGPSATHERVDAPGRS